MSTYFVKGMYNTLGGDIYTFGIVFDLQPVNAENFNRQLRLELELGETESINIEDIKAL